MNRQVQPTNRVNWNDAYLTAHSVKEPLQDVNLITAKSDFFKLVYDVAASSLYKNGFTLTKNAVDTVVKTLIETKSIHVYERVTINERGITVCIDAPNVENLDVTFRALDMLADALDHLCGDYGEVTFGLPLHFTQEQLASILVN